METPEADRLAVAHALERVIGWLRDAREPSGLSASALSALSRLDALGSLRVTELAEREQLTQPGMTTLINRLEDAGFAVREPDPTDGRAVRVTITSAGTTRVREHRDARADLIGARVAQLSHDEQVALIAALPALRSFATHPAPAQRHNERGIDS
ncbi:MAG TPA: MarR family transcriptional regulator [Galbitalea sp.]|nr:MarR family transcriptional regulator [Galbitalea sp.]